MVHSGATNSEQVLIQIFLLLCSDLFVLHNLFPVLILFTHTAVLYVPENISSVVAAVQFDYFFLNIWIYFDM
jgi:hypothetical protein